MTEMVSDALPSNPLTSHDADPRAVLDPGFLRAALQHRVARLLHTAAARLSTHTQQVGPF